MAEGNSSNSKGAPLPWIILSGFLGVFAVGAPNATNTAPRPTPTVKTAEANKENAAVARVSWREPLKPIYDFYATQDFNWDPRKYLLEGRHGYQAEFLIATVPDPIDSPYGFAFDQVVDAVQRAVEKKDGYVLDRSWLPWELDKKGLKPIKLTVKPDANAAPAAKDDDEQTFRERYPGVLLFRHGRNKKRNINTPSLCVVFLIGETPMGGMHKRAFTESLRMMMLAGHPKDKPVRVIGPYFSGTQTSLQFTIGDWWESCEGWYAGDPRYTFKVITGNATAVRKSDFFQFDARDPVSANWDPKRFEFSSTVIPTRLTLNGVLRYLSRRDGSSADDAVDSSASVLLPGKVALLTESNTGFGSQFTSVEKDQELLILRFPLHISRVKSEFTQNFRKQDEAKGLTHSDSLVPSIFEESEGTREGIPSQGGSTTTATNGQALANILSTISKEKCRYVGVIASDTRDKLFLIRLIKEYCPDVQIFITEADMLLTHPDYRYHLRGVMVGSTYPLQPANQRWVKANSTERILFPSNGAQGYYNAALMHLDLHQHLLEYQPPSFTLNSLDDESAAKRPPIWISVVAPNGTLVPLHLFTKYKDTSGYVAKNDTSRDAEAEPTPLYYPGAVVPFGVGLFLFWGYLLYQGLFNRSAALFWHPRTREATDLTLANLCYRNLILGVQLLVSVPLLGLAVTQAETHHYRGSGSLLVVSLASLFSVGFVLAMFRPLVWPRLGWAKFRSFFRRDARGRHIDQWMWLILNVLICTVAISFALLLLLRFWIYGDETRRTLFFLRSIDIGTGLSPLTPMVFMALGFTVWGYFHLRRVGLADRYSVAVPYPVPENERERNFFARIHAQDAELREEIEHEHFLSRHGVSVALALVALAAGSFGVWQQSLPTVESWAWDAAFFVGFTLLFSLCAATLFHLFSLWSHLRKLLEAIAMVPMVRGFDKLPVKITEIFGKYLVMLKPNIAHFQYPAHQLTSLAGAVQKDQTAPEGLKAIPPLAEKIDLDLRKQLAVDSKSTQEDENRLRDDFSDVSRQCVRALMPAWKNQGVDEAFGGAYADAQPSLAQVLLATQIKQEPPPAPPAWKTLSEAVVSTQVVVYLSQFFIHLRNLVWALLLSSSLLLLAATSYPFHPERLLLFCMLGLIGAGVAGVLYVLIGMNRDEVLSRIAKTAPGKFSLDSGFIGSFFTYIVPTVGILAAQLSGSFRWVLEPILRVLK